jgi:cation transport regulator ChaB
MTLSLMKIRMLALGKSLKGTAIRMAFLNTDVIAQIHHVAFETFRDIGGLADEDNQEPFAYLVGWVAKQINYAMNYKKHKNK